MGSSTLASELPQSRDGKFPVCKFAVCAYTPSVVFVPGLCTCLYVWLQGRCRSADDQASFAVSLAAHVPAGLPCWLRR